MSIDHGIIIWLWLKKSKVHLKYTALMLVCAWDVCDEYFYFLLNLTVTELVLLRQPPITENLGFLSQPPRLKPRFVV